jgi:hypothetical protein
MGYDDISLVPGEVAHPVALKGRVPIRLSDENGPIMKGDRIALSSIPGVGMKATESDMTVGIALEDYEGDHAYSAGYLNQFGDDLVKAKMQPFSKETDVRTQDGCSYGGGSAQGDTPCVKDTVSKIKVETVTVDNRTEVLRELAAETPEVMTIDGDQEVSVGQAIMFVDLQYHFADAETTILKELLSTSTVENGDGEETLWNRLKTLAQNFVDGVLTITGLKVDKIEVQNELCVGSVCVDEATFLKMVQTANGVQGGGEESEPEDPTPEPEPMPEPDPTPQPEPTEDGESTNGGDSGDTGGVVEEEPTAPEEQTEETPEQEGDTETTDETEDNTDSEPAPEPTPEPSVPDVEPAL